MNTTQKFVRNAALALATPLIMAGNFGCSKGSSPTPQPDPPPTGGGNPPATTAKNMLISGGTGTFKAGTTEIDIMKFPLTGGGEVDFRTGGEFNITQKNRYADSTTVSFSGTTAVVDYKNDLNVTNIADVPAKRLETALHWEVKDKKGNIWRLYLNNDATAGSGKQSFARSGGGLTMNDFTNDKLGTYNTQVDKQDINLKLN